MPIYEYQCTACDHSFEQRQGFDADPICACPQCENQARRLFQPAPIIFKGSGFYVTDYNGKSPSATHSSSEEGSNTESNGTATPASTSEPSQSTTE